MQHDIEIINIQDHLLTEKMKLQLSALLEISFPGFFNGRVYYKQLPHFRLLACEEDVVIGQLGVDCRIINVGGVVLNILGVIDLCVVPEERGQGIATKLLEAAERIAVKSSQDFMILIADRHEIYERLGFERVQPAKAKWLAIEERASVRVIEDDLSDCFLAKSICGGSWPAGKIDMLGYMF
ncbi:GNAT family N-acetyltransferase [Poriferisphaera sp. WC338]|uniref:GNAT family N-acetyltransferase n=1 Tax=Poriferisphaera sp. WC338 TaxID=3425129 RepID=UPI003D8179C6